jgi:hypothetical protein
MSMRFTLFFFLLFISGCFEADSTSDLDDSSAAPPGLDAETKSKASDAGFESLGVTPDEEAKQSTSWFEGSAEELKAGSESAPEFRENLARKLIDALAGAPVEVIFVDYVVDNLQNTWGDLPYDFVSTAYPDVAGFSELNELPKESKVEMSLFEMIFHTVETLHNKKFAYVQGFDAKTYSLLIQKKEKAVCTTDCIEFVDYRFQLPDGRILSLRQNMLNTKVSITIPNVVHGFNYTFRYM